MQNNPRSYKKFKKTPLFFSLIFLVFSCSAFFFLYKEISNNKKIGELAQIEWQNEVSKRDKIKLLDRSVEAIKTEKTLLESHFVQSSNIVPFLDTIEQLALKASTKSEVVSVNIPKDKSGLQVEIKSTGNFEAVYKFLMLLENSPYELEFTAVSMQRLSEQTVSDKKIKAAEWEAIFKIKLLSFVQ